MNVNLLVPLLLLFIILILGFAIFGASRIPSPFRPSPSVEVGNIGLLIALATLIVIIVVALTAK